MTAGLRLAQATSAFRRIIVERHAEGSLLTGLSTGWQDVDRITGGLPETGVTLISAGPLMPTSAIALGLVRHIALSSGRPVLYAHPTRAIEELLARLVALDIGVPIRHLKSGRLTEPQLRRLERALGRIDSAPCHVLVRQPSNPAALGMAAQAVATEHGRFPVLVLDGVIPNEAGRTGVRLEDLHHVALEDVAVVGVTAERVRGVPPALALRVDREGPQLVRVTVLDEAGGQVDSTELAFDGVIGRLADLAGEEGA